MKRFSVGFACALLGGIPCFAQLDEALEQIQVADVHALLRQTVVKVEEKFKGVHAEADGLAQLVDEILAAPEPPETTGGNRNQQRSAEMELISVNTEASATLASVRGFVFDNNRAGRRQRYEELEAEVLRWLEMRHMAERLEWKDKERLCDERALRAARALVARVPKSAATFLKENQSKATQRKAAAIYDKTEKLLEERRNARQGQTGDAGAKRCALSGHLRQR